MMLQAKVSEKLVNIEDKQWCMLTEDESSRLGSPKSKVDPK
jgi:hypothetical protein